MKKIFSSVMATVLAASVFFAGCSGVQTENGETSTTAYTGSYGKYAQIGTDVYAALGEAFGSSEKARAVLEGTSTIDGETSFVVPSLSELQANGCISEIAASYMQRMENVIDTEESDASIVSEITAIENSAVENLFGDDLDAVMTYAETAKATLAYFTNADDEVLMRSAWSRFKKKATRVIKSAAIGAVAGLGSGAVTGAITGAANAGVGALPGAVAGAVGGAIIGAVASGISEATN